MKNKMMPARGKLVAVVLALGAGVAGLQAPAQAHHREEHQGGPAPSPSPSPSPTTEPTPEPTPTTAPSPTPTPQPGGQPANPCLSLQLWCKAVSDDGVLQVTAVVEATPWVPFCVIGCGIVPYVGVPNPPSADFQVYVDTGSGPQLVCSGHAGAVPGTCVAFVEVPVGVPVYCTAEVQSRAISRTVLACL